MNDSTDVGADDEPGDGSSDQSSSEWSSEAWYFVQDTARALLIVAVFASLLFAYTGLWPPFVSVLSGSMEPELERGDLVLVMEPTRSDAPDTHTRHGVVSYEQGKSIGYQSIGDYGDVIIFAPNQSDMVQKEIIHRAHFWVEEDENWHSSANGEYISASNCEELRHCPAPHAGFITKGDANDRYDQASGISAPVPASNVYGTAQFDVPYFGYVRLLIE